MRLSPRSPRGIPVGSRVEKTDLGCACRRSERRVKVVDVQGQVQRQVPDLLPDSGVIAVDPDLLDLPRPEAVNPKPTSSPRSSGQYFDPRMPMCIE